MSEVVVVAVMHAADGQRDGIERVARDVLIPATHEEHGCITFALHRDSRDPNCLVIIERWADAAALGRHMETAHLADFRAQVGPLSASIPDIYVLEGSAAGDAVKGVLGGS